MKFCQQHLQHWLPEFQFAHIHGGEVTVGAFDDAIRHAITKMSWIHFATNRIYKKRIIQLGEHPSRYSISVDLAQRD